jgi:heterodisulfide reductase subunit B2
MKFALFLGCKIPPFQPQYETSTRLVCSTLGVDLATLEFNCCGYPIRQLDFYSYIFSAARNLALAEREGLDLVTPCKCCYGSLKKAHAFLAERPELLQRVKNDLADDGLDYRGELRINHLLQVLYHDVGLDAIKAAAGKPFQGLPVAVHYGCHALRPSNVMAFDNPYHPVKFDQLVEATGAVSVQWQRKLQCCGNPLWEKNSDLSMLLTEKKLDDAHGAGAQYICTACTYCQIQFDAVQQIMLNGQKQKSPLPAILYPQLLGLSMGFSIQDLGMDAHQLDPGAIVGFQEIPAAA